MKTVATVAMIVGAVALIATGIGAIVGGAAFMAMTGVSLATVSMIGSIAGIVGAFAQNALRAKASKIGSISEFRIDPQAGIPYAMGVIAYGGNVIHRESFGNDNKYQNFATVWSGGGPVEELTQFYADRKPVNFTAMANAIGSYDSFMFLVTQKGLCPSPSLQGPASSERFDIPGIRGNANFKLSGYAAGLWGLKFDLRDKPKKFLGGPPRPLMKMKGVLVYDPRQDSTYPGGNGPCRALDESTYVGGAAARNPWLHELTFALGRWQNGKKVLGAGIPIASIDVASLVEAANVADANGWTIGGVISSADEKWNALKLIAQAGGGEPMRLGARLSCMVNAPKVSLATVQEADLIGAGRVQGTRSRRGRINGVIPRYISEAHGWEAIPADAVRVPAYEALDGGQRTRELDYPMVTDLTQATQLAAYDIVNAREIGPITLPLKLKWIGYAPGDCITVNLPKLGLNNQPCVIRTRTLDPATGTVTLTLESETTSKHPFALGQVGSGPPIPVLTGPDEEVAAPLPGEWTVTGGAIGGAAGQTPALILNGAVLRADVEEVAFEYRLAAGPGPWISAGTEPPQVTVKNITPVAPLTSYEAAISYKVRGLLGERVILGPVTSGTDVSGTAVEVTGPVDIGLIVDPTGPAPTTPLGPGALITNLGTAAGIFGQGALATANNVDWGSEVIGSTRPEDYASVGENLIFNSRLQEQ